MYIAEISPASYRGRLVAVTQFNIVLGILLAYLSNYVIARLHLGATEWRWMFGVMAVPAAAVLPAPVPHAREPPLAGRPGPRWTRPAPCWSGSAPTPAAWTRRSREIQASLDLEHHGARRAVFRRSTASRSCWPWPSPMFNQLSGINALIYYAPHIFKMAGAGDDSALLKR